MEKTIAQLKAQNMDYVGGGLDHNEAHETLYKTIGGETFAFINCCEHEFSIATEQSGGSNPLNPVMQWYAITEAKQKADHVIVIVHGGPEHYSLPTPRMTAEAIMIRFEEYSPRRKTAITGSVAPASGNPANELY